MAFESTTKDSILVETFV